MTALAAGSMVPDIPLFMSWTRGYEVTHSLLGILVVDVVLTCGAVLLWVFLARDALVDMAPSSVRSRLPVRARPTQREWLLTPIAGSVGAATHFLWDSFTHPGRWGPRHIAWLRTDHAGLEGLKWAQYVSGVLGLAVVTWVIVRYLRSLDPVWADREPSVLPPAVLPVVVATSALIGLIAAVVQVPDGFHMMAFEGVVSSLIAVTGLGTLACVVWQSARRRAVSPPASAR